MRKLALLTAVAAAIVSLWAGSALAAGKPPHKPSIDSVAAYIEAAPADWQTPSDISQIEQLTADGTTVKLVASASDALGHTVTSWNWTIDTGETPLLGSGGNTVIYLLPLGPHHVDLTVTCSGGATSNTKQLNVHIRDTTAPSITAPADIEQEQTSLAGSEVVALGDPTVSDICDGDVTVTSDAPAVFPLGLTMVTWTATDASGNAATATQNVTVTDTTAPRLAAPADIEQEQTTLAGTEVVELGTASATDICDGDVTVTNDAPATFALGTTPVTYTATDAAGNIATEVQQVTVTDSQAPTLTVPADVGPVEQTGLDGTPVAIGTASATDICDADVAIANDAPAVFQLGTTTVTWIATDDTGNETTAEQTVTVEDTTAPNLTVTNNIAGGNASMSTPAVPVKAVTVSSVSDICDAAPVVTMVWSNDGAKGWPAGTKVWVGATEVAANTPVLVPVGSEVFVYTVSFTSNYRCILNFEATDETGNVTATQKVINLNKPSGGGGGGPATGSFKAGAS